MVKIMRTSTVQTQDEAVFQGNNLCRIHDGIAIVSKKASSRVWLGSVSRNVHNTCADENTVSISCPYPACMLRDMSNLTEE